MYSATTDKTTHNRIILTLFLLVTLLAHVARPAQAQTETVLYNFTSIPDAANPTSSLIFDSAGNLYGTTIYGGSGCGTNQYGCGTVFEISPSPSGAWKETVLHSFSGPPDAANPFVMPVIFDKLGNIYGPTQWGGAYNIGTAFELAPAGANWTETILYSFGSNWYDGFVSGGLIMDSAGNLYGTTDNFYTNTSTVFELSPSGDGWTEQVIYTPDTCCATSGLVMDASGNLFGNGGSNVFELSPNGNGGWNPTVLHTFTGSPKDGSVPGSVLVFDQAGNLYGTTDAGGAKNYGTVYKLIPPMKKWQKGEWKEEILHSFAGGKDGTGPVSAVVFDTAGNMYGTTYYGGKFGDGIVFELSPQVGKSWYKEKILWTFNGTDGGGSWAGLTLDSAGNLYGTTSNGGSSNYGVVFELTP